MNLPRQNMPVQNEGGIPLNWMQTKIFNSCLEDRISWRVKGSYLMTHATHLTWHPSELMTWHPSERSLNAKKENFIHSIQQHSCRHWPQWLSMTMATTLSWKRKVKLLKLYTFSSWRWLSHSWSRAPTMSHQCRMNASIVADGFIRSKFKQSNGRAKILVLHQPKMLGFICSRPQLIVIDLTQRYNKF